MRAVIQRVKQAKVEVDNQTVGSINKGILVLLGFHKNDQKNQIGYLIDKIINLRIFSDQADKMNLSLLDVKGDILVVSQFTLYGETKKGRRPSFVDSLEPKTANEYYENFVELLKNQMKNVQTGIFGAKMKVHLINDGPVTFIIDAD